MIHITKITLHWAEGKQNGLIFPMEFNYGVIRDDGNMVSVWNHIQAELIRVASITGAPTFEEGGYNKVKFTIEWEDGESYTGRFDMVKGGTNDGGHTLRQQVIHFCEWVTNQIEDPERREQCVEWMRYYLGHVPTRHATRNTHATHTQQSTPIT